MNFSTPRTTTSRRRMHRRALVAVAAIIAIALATPSVAKTLKIATGAPDGTAWMKLLRQAGADVEAATNGRVTLRFYPGGTQGDDRDVLRKMRIGQLHGGTVRTGVFGGIYSDIQLYNLPMVFRNLDEVDAVRKVMDPVLIEGLAQAGFIAFGIAEVGMAYAMSTKQASAIADARRLKVWSPQGDVPAARTLEAFGISPIPLTIAEVLQSLTSGAIDTVAAPPVAVLPLLWHTRLKYVLDLPFMYIYSPLVVSERGLRGIESADLEVLHRALGRAVAEADRLNRADHDGSWAALRRQGLEFVSPTPAEVNEWRTVAATAMKIWVDEGLVSKPLYDRLEAVLAEIRSGHAAKKKVAKPAVAGD